MLDVTATDVIAPDRERGAGATMPVRRRRVAPVARLRVAAATPAAIPALVPVLDLREPAPLAELSPVLSRCGFGAMVVRIGANTAVADLQALTALPLCAWLSCRADWQLAQRAGISGQLTAHELRWSGLPAPHALSQRHLLRLHQAGTRHVVLAPTELQQGLRWLQLMAQQAPTMTATVINVGSAFDAALYLAHAAVRTVFANWILTPELLRRRDWSSLQRRAHAARELRADTESSSH